MPILEARINTERPGRYITQFSKHAQAMTSPRAGLLHRDRHGGAGHAPLSVSSSETDTTITFPGSGRCILRAQSGMLIVRIEAPDLETAARIREIITRDLNRFGRGSLDASWHTIGTTPNDSNEVDNE